MASARYLIDKGADVNLATEPDGVTPLHLIASFNPQYALSTPSLNTAVGEERSESSQQTLIEEVAELCKKLIEQKADVNKLAPSLRNNTPLHCAVQSGNEPVFSALLQSTDANNFTLENSYGQTALWLALQNLTPEVVAREKSSSSSSSLEESMAARMIKCGASVDAVDLQSGDSLLHKSARAANQSAGIFLVLRGAAVNHLNNKGESPLHLACSFGLARLAELLLNHSADPNLQTFSPPPPTSTHSTENNSTAITESPANLHSSQKPIASYGGENTKAKARKNVRFSTGDDNNPFADDDENVNPFEDDDNAGDGNPFGEDEVNRSSRQTGNFIGNALQNAKGRGSPEKSGRVGCKQLDGDIGLTSLSLSTTDSDVMCYLQTPLHLAIINRHSDIIKIFIDFKNKCLSGVSSSQPLICPDFQIKDSNGQSVFALALLNAFLDTAVQLLQAGCDVNERNAEGLSLLHQVILHQDSKSASFLLHHGANIEEKAPDGRTPLQMATLRHLPLVVRELCQLGAQLNITDTDGDTPLWQALDSGQHDIASILIEYKCDSDFWSPGPAGCRQTLLHRAIDESNEHIASFLIKHGCSLKVCRRPGPGGEGEEEARDKQTPLHMASNWGLEEVVQSLIERLDDVNTQDAQGRTALHLAIINHHDAVTSLIMSHPSPVDLSIRDNDNMSVFSTAMTVKNQRAANLILNRDPTVAEQYDARGRNFLHVAIEKSDLDSVLFLISINANVNSPVKDGKNWSPLHLAVQAASEIIVRNLLLAGAAVNALTAQRQTCLHIAAGLSTAPTSSASSTSTSSSSSGRRTTRGGNMSSTTASSSPGGAAGAITSVLLENGARVDLADDSGSNVLHTAVRAGSLSVSSILIQESEVDVSALNKRGYTPLHMLAHYGKESAAAIFDILITRYPTYDIDAIEPGGSSALLLAYIHGNAQLCRSLVKAGACLATENKEGVSIFNHPVPTKQLLCKLLDMLTKEPPWTDSDHCMECTTKFGITTRKHHCRHCGRVLCAKCSENDIPIPKFCHNKPVRVCDICFDINSGTIY